MFILTFLLSYFDNKSFLFSQHSLPSCPSISSFIFPAEHLNTFVFIFFWTSSYYKINPYKAFNITFIDAMKYYIILLINISVFLTIKYGFCLLNIYYNNEIT